MINTTYGPIEYSAQWNKFDKQVENKRRNRQSLVQSTKDFFVCCVTSNTSTPFLKVELRHVGVTLSTSAQLDSLPVTPLLLAFTFIPLVPSHWMCNVYFSVSLCLCQSVYFCVHMPFCFFMCLCVFLSICCFVLSLQIYMSAYINW